MTALPPERPLILTARRIRDERVDAAHDEPPAKDPWIADLIAAGLVRLHFTAAHRRTPDYWVLTDEGERWLAEDDKEMS